MKKQEREQISSCLKIEKKKSYSYNGKNSKFDQKLTYKLFFSRAKTNQTSKPKINPIHNSSPNTNYNANPDANPDANPNP